MFWRRPLLWITVCWIAGMTMASSFSFYWSAGLGVCTGVIAVLLHGFQRKGGLAAFILSVTVILGGGMFAWSEARSGSGISLPDDTEAGISMRGHIVSEPKTDGDRIVFDLEAMEASIEETAYSLPKGERIKVYVRLHAQEEQLEASRWYRGDEVNVAGVLKRPLTATNFEGFDYRLYLRRQHIFWTVHADGTAVQRSEPARWTMARALSYVDRVRAEMGSRTDSLFGPTASGFMKGLLLGVTDDIDPEQYRAFSQIGLTHILAISGLHVAIYVGSLLWILGKLPFTKETRLLIAMAAIPAYVLITGASPSVIRAGLMSIIALYAARRGLLKDGLHILAAAALLMLVLNPFYLYNVSFQLSFAVTAGLILLTPLMNEWLHWIRYPSLRSAVAVTLVAQFVSFPLTITYFNSFSLMSFPANLVLVPVFSLAVLPLGTIALVLSYIAPPIASYAAMGGEWITAISFHAVHWLNRFTSAAMIWPTPPLWWLAAYYIILYVGIAVGAGKLRVDWPRWMALASCGGMLFGLLAYAYAPNYLDRAAIISMIDVGQGDAILIRTPHGKHALIDGGGTISFRKPGEEWKLRADPFEVGEDVVVPLLKRRGVQHIDALLISHSDSDHIGGLQAVLDQIPVYRLFFNGTVKPNDTSERLFRTALQRRVPLTPAHEGMTIRLDALTEIKLLYPKAREKIVVEKDQNEQSLAFLLTVYGRSFLFAGDLSSREERALASDPIVQAAAAAEKSIDVLKISHHGSKSSTPQEWLDLWKPRAAAISVGRTNYYGHPHPTVTERLQSNGIKTYRTDTQGEVQFRITRDSFQVRTRL